MDLKSLQDLISLLRRNGVLNYNDGNLALTLGPEPVALSEEKRSPALKTRRSLLDHESLKGLRPEPVK